LSREREERRKTKKTKEKQMSETPYTDALPAFGGKNGVRRDAVKHIELEMIFWRERCLKMRHILDSIDSRIGMMESVLCGYRDKQRSGEYDPSRD
jgi:hypothetical protein